MSNHHNEDKMEVESSRIDEGLYSRQLYVLGHEAMKKMSTSTVLIVGVGGLGVEIAKDLILTGVKSVTLFDNNKVTIHDLSAQYYLTEKDIGKSRALTSLEKLAQLNPYVPVNVHTGDLSDNFLKNFKVIILVDQPLDFQLKINQFCHSHNIAFISTELKGVFGNIFCDFGEDFTVIDSNGEPPFSAIVSGVTQENPGVVTVVDEHRLQFEDGDYVVFSEVQGMEELNQGPPRKIKILGPYTFSIEDTTNYHAYKTGGYVTQVKQPVKHKFLPLEQALQNPEYLISDFAKFDRPDTLHLGFQALHEFRKKHNKLPQPHNEDHANEFLNIVKSINEKQKRVENIDEKLLKQLAYGSVAELAPMAAFIGGIAAQEALKACSGKFTPIKQWFYFDVTEVLPPDALPASEFQLKNSRYDSMIAVFGNTLQEKIRQLNYFIVGAGAIGCEVLKIWAMMGLGTGPNGMIHITDMDIIEKSNLNRQFLFREKDIESLKSKTAANAIKQMNPEVNIQSYSLRVGAETEDYFDDNFYNSLNGVCNALDNVEARMYMDSRCIFYKKSLLESGTLGTKGNTQVVVPFLTESYGSSRDPPEKSIPICTLHHFPNNIEHTIQWARDIFEGLFKNHPENVNSYLSNPNYLDSLQKQNTGVKLETLSNIKSCLVDEKPLSFEQCVQWARLKFEEYFNNNIQQLLFNFPVDMITSTGAPFWSGPKRAPKPVQFDMNNSLHLDFILAAANLRAQIYGLKGERSIGALKKHLPNIIVPDFVPKKVKINVEEKETDKNKQPELPDEDEEDKCKQILGELPSPSKLAGYRMNPIDFEKDNDENFHMDFITATANLRATNYSIPLADKHKCKGIAGKIIPAMVTTTAVVSGLVCLELLKIIQDKPLESYKNGFVNLALPFFGFSEPIKPTQTKIRDDWLWSLWDRFDVKGDMTLKEFINHFKEKYKLEVTMISSGVSMIYSFFMNKQKIEERMPQKMSTLVETISKQPIPPKKKAITFEICANRIEDDEEVDVPYVRYEFR